MGLDELHTRNISHGGKACTFFFCCCFCRMKKLIFALNRPQVVQCSARRQRCDQAFRLFCGQNPQPSAGRHAPERAKGDIYAVQRRHPPRRLAHARNALWDVLVLFVHIPPGRCTANPRVCVSRCVRLYAAVLQQVPFLSGKKNKLKCFSIGSGLCDLLLPISCNTLS